MGLREEISRRRTFAIISHPDAGKTTLSALQRTRTLCSLGEGAKGRSVI